MLDAMKHIKNNMDSITVPFLALHGSDDQLCLLSGSQMLAEKAGSTDKTLKVSLLALQVGLCQLHARQQLDLHV